MAWVPSGDAWLGIGPLLQVSFPARSDPDPATRHHRLVVAGEIAWTGLGVELGYAYLSASSEASSTHAVHLAPFLSIGILSVATPLTIPIAHVGDREAHPFDLGLMVSIKFPFLLERDAVRPWWSFLDSYGGQPRPPPSAEGSGR